MYRVIEMYGDFEPWWFIEGWEEDVISSKKFENYYDALKYYKSCWFELEKKIHWTCRIKNDGTTF